jgi:hypothetical protein
MNLSLLLDNDVLIKCSSYSLLNQIRPPGGAEGEMGVLGSAPFVVKDYLRRRGSISDRESAQKCFEEYLSTVTVLEPTDDELVLASAIEESAIDLGLDLDGGESQLCAIAVSRVLPFLLTGDKRAIRGAEVLQGTIPAITSLGGRIVCLEQAVMGIVARIGKDEVRTMVCAEPDTDRSLSICFACHAHAEATSFSLDGLASYVRDMRLHAPTLLYELDAM